MTETPTEKPIQPITGPIEIFYSYARADEDLRKELEMHLSVLRRQKFITAWYDRKIEAGEEWAGKIDEHVNSAKVILLLVSPHFVASNYSNDVEVKRALERHEEGTARVIPVILRPVDWTLEPYSKLQALPKDAKPVTTWSNRDEAFLDIAKGIRAVIGTLTGKKI